MNKLIEKIEQVLASEDMVAYREFMPVDVSNMVLGDLRVMPECFSCVPRGFTNPRLRYVSSFQPVKRRSALPLSLPKTDFKAPARKQEMLSLLSSINAAVTFFEQVRDDFPSIEFPALNSKISDPKTYGDTYKAMYKWVQKECDDVDLFLVDYLAEREMFIDEDYDDTTLLDEDGLYLPLPFRHYDEDGAYSFIAFIEGRESVAGVLAEKFEEWNGNDNLDWLSEQDKKMCLSLNWQEAMKIYVESSLDKVCDIKALANCCDTYFSHLAKIDPDWEEKTHGVIYAAMDEPSFQITSASDFELYAAYLRAWERFEGENPGGYMFEEEPEQGAGYFIADVLRVYRIEKGLICPLPEKHETLALAA